MRHLYLNLRTDILGASSTPTGGLATRESNPDGRSLAAIKKTRKLAAQHGSDVCKDAAGGWWVTCKKFTGSDDPLNGSNFCDGSQEVLEAVHVDIGTIVSPRENQ